MNDDLFPPQFWRNHAIRTHLTTLLGNAQLLRRRITRSAELTPPERDPLLKKVTAMEQATRELQRDLEPQFIPPSETDPRTS